jgi:hypothetical protein
MYFLVVFSLHWCIHIFLFFFTKNRRKGFHQNYSE